MLLICDNAMVCMRIAMCGGPFNEMPSDHIRRFMSAYESGAFGNVPQIKGEFDHVIVAGMGGSGIIGSAVVDMTRNLSGTPVDVLRANRLPAYASDGALIIVISYSGNTREMIDLYKDCKDRGCNVIAVTSGGKLADMVEADANPLIRVKGGFTPRSDIGIVIGYVASIIDKNCGTSFLKGYVDAMSSAIPYSDALADTSDLENEAMRIAHRLTSRIPFIYSMDGMSCVANRWKCQINENAKIPAACGMFPEFNHNSLEGWCGNVSNILIPIFLGPHDRFVDSAASIMEEKGNPMMFIDIPGDSEIEMLVNGIILGDYVSLYLADLMKRDASPVPAITEFKKRTSL